MGLVCCTALLSQRFSLAAATHGWHNAYKLLRTAAFYYHHCTDALTCQHFVNILPAATLDNPPDRALHQVQQVVVLPEPDEHDCWECQHLRCNIHKLRGGSC